MKAIIGTWQPNAILATRLDPTLEGKNAMKDIRSTENLDYR